MKQPWPIVKLGEVISQERDPVGTFDGDGLPVLGVTNIEGVTQTGVAASDDKSKYLRLRPGRFVYNPYRINVGSIGLSSESQDGICSPAYVVFRPMDRLDARFLWFFLKSAKGDQLINFHGNRGTVRSALRFDDLAQIEIPLPPLAEQRRIVARIEELAAQIHEAQSIRQQAAQEAEALLKASLSFCLKDAAKKHGLNKLGDVAKCAAGFGFPKQYQGKTEGKYPFAKVSDMNLPGNERAVITANNWVDDDDVTEMRLKIYPIGTVIFPKIGGAIATNKRRFLARPATFDNNVMGLIPTSDMLPEYLFCFMQSFDLVELQAGTSVPAISQSKVESLSISVPPLAEQRRIVAELDALQAEVDALKKLQAETAAELDALLPSLLDRAFKGEL